MKRLGFRLGLSLIAVSLVGLSVLDVVFVLWTQQQLSRERRMQLHAAALAGATRLVSVPADALLQQKTILENVASEYGVSMALQTEDGEIRATNATSLPLFANRALAFAMENGIEYAAAQVPAQGWLQRVVASLPLEYSIQRLSRIHQSAIAVLAIVALLMVGVGLAFLRRSVLQPLTRMNTLVGSHDYDGLSRFERSAAWGGRQDDDFGQLSRGIIGMTQRLEEDRQKIAQQVETLKATNLDLQNTQQQLVRAARLAVVGQLAAGVAHEIGNPIAIIGGYLEIIRDEVRAKPNEPLEQASRNAIDRVLHELDRIRAIVRNLLDFSRSQRGARGLGSISGVMEHVTALVRPRAGHATLTVEIPNGLPPVGITSDALTQVLLNLVLNALDAVDNEGGRAHVRVRAASHDGSVAIHVEDNGPGVTKTVEKRVFEPFFTTKPSGAGTGLGLSVCEQILASVDGDIQYGESDLGGACFTVLVPIAPTQ